jgi:hypothetical protein
MILRLREVLIWGVLGAVVAVGTTYAALVHSLMKYEPKDLRSCITVESGWMRWTCKKVLYVAPWSPEHLRLLNEDAGIRFAFGSVPPATPQEEQEEEEYLKLFLARGVDINARITLTRPLFDNWTALHEAAITSDLHKAQLLLKYGARTDLRDSKGMTALDIARSIQQKNSGESKAEKLVQLLESTNSPKL